MYLDALSFLEDERDGFRAYEALDALTDEELDRPVEAAGGWSGRDLMGHIVAVAGGGADDGQGARGQRDEPDQGLARRRVGQARGGGPDERGGPGALPGAADGRGPAPVPRDRGRAARLPHGRARVALDQAHRPPELLLQRDRSSTTRTTRPSCARSSRRRVDDERRRAADRRPRRRRASTTTRRWTRPRRPTRRRSRAPTPTSRSTSGSARVLDGLDDVTRTREGDVERLAVGGRVFAVLGADLLEVGLDARDREGRAVDARHPAVAPRRRLDRLHARPRPTASRSTAPRRGSASPTAGPGGAG